MAEATPLLPASARNQDDDDGATQHARLRRTVVFAVFGVAAAGVAAAATVAVINGKNPADSSMQQLRFVLAELIFLS